MLINLAIFQSDLPSAGRAFALEQANSLGFAVFFVGLMLILLLVIHYYRMKTKIDSKDKSRGKESRYSRTDGISQLEFMTKDELKQMILTERARKEADGEVEEISGTASVTEALIVAEIVPEKKTVASNELLLFDDQLTSSGIRKVKTDSSGVENAGLQEPVSGDDKAEESVQPEKQPVKNPYTDKIERTPLSTEFPEDFKKSSRKI